ncbi:MAG: rhodanese-like domain-containing protein [Verrucomicrobiota bacterium]|jgi:phage shock protein E|nr:rhodanese-like domain-containing protein [Verrucomicrobiota bacterium]
MKLNQYLVLLTITGLLTLGVVIFIYVGSRDLVDENLLPEPPVTDGVVAPGHPVLIDARSADEYAAGHIEGAILIPYAQAGDLIEAEVPDKRTQIYVYCSRGWRSEMAQKAMRAKGYPNVENLGGMEAAADTLKKEIIRD